MLVDPPPHLRRHPRIAVLGVTGSGKSTLGARLAALTGAPLVPVDDLMWRRGWVQLTDSILAWHFRSFPTKHAAIAAWAADAGGSPVVRFTSPRQVDAWLRALERAHAGSHPDSR